MVAGDSEKGCLKSSESFGLFPGSCPGKRQDKPLASPSLQDITVTFRHRLPRQYDLERNTLSPTLAIAQNKPKSSMAKDLFHNAVRHALEKEQWMITSDPLFLRFGGVEMYIDLGAERILAAEKAGQKIAVEIKSFAGASATTEFNGALGQFLKYQLALEEEEPDRKLYLAVPFDVYRAFFSLELIRLLIQRYQVCLIVYEPETEEIVKWQN
jgi:hypothetical protein